MTQRRRGTKTTSVVIPSSPQSSQTGDSYIPQVGDKVKVIGHMFPWMERFVGREGTVAGALTGKSCTVQIKGGLKRWFDNRELELVKRKKNV